MQITYYPVTQCAPYLRTEGRVTMTAEGLLMDWSAAGFTFRFRGNGVTLFFQRFRDMQPICGLALLDGVRYPFASADGTAPLVLNCETGEHTLTFLRLSEGGVRFLCRVIRISSPAGDDAPAGAPAPALLAPPAPKTRKLTFFGDSITCGYGNCGDETSGGFLTWEEDPTRGYAYRTAELLDAEAELVCISGQGIVKNCNGDMGNPIPRFWCRQNLSYDTPYDTHRQPDAVIINAGTNDCGGRVTHEEFYAGAEAFLRELRRAYPDAEIVWFYGLMGLYYDETLKRLIETLAPELGHLTYLPADPIYNHAQEGEIGANGHPSVEGAERGARQLSAKLSELLGW